MTREEKIDQLMVQLDDNTNLRTILRAVIKDAITKLDDSNLDRIFYTLNPLPEIPEE